MDRNIAVRLAQQAIKSNNKRLVDSVLAIKAERDKSPAKEQSIDQLPMVAVTCATGWECYAVVEELTKTRKFRVRALFRTPGTSAAARLERLFVSFTLFLGFMIAPIVQMSNIGSQLTEAFAGLDRTQELMNLPEETEKLITMAMIRWVADRW